MFVRSSIRLYGLLLAALFGFMARPATAQFIPRTLEDPATGEKYHIEGSILLWAPSSDIVVRSDGLGIVGSQVDFRKDLGLKNSKLPEFHVVLRPGRKHKLRLDYIPVKYESPDGGFPVKREIVFQGQKYTLGVPVIWSIDWRALRYTYEYDFVSKDRGFGGFLLEVKHPRLAASLRSPARPDADTFVNEYPIPALGGIFRVYVVPNISITGEVAGVAVPKELELDGNGHYVDYDFYGTLNLTNNLGVQVGYRSLDFGIEVKGTKGGDLNMLLKGLYFGAVARF
jgi:hypothetical protein